MHANIGGTWKKAKTVYVNIGGVWKPISFGLEATGGQITTAVIGSSNYKLHTFDAFSDYHTFTVTSGEGEIEVLLLGGGASGGCEQGGGGGGGGSKVAVFNTGPESYIVVAGKGGQSQTTAGRSGYAGGMSRFYTASFSINHEVSGGGAGGGTDYPNGVASVAGGGGGGGTGMSSGKGGTSSYAYAGGNAATRAGGGGGGLQGAGGVGATLGGVGGAPRYMNLNGMWNYYGGGGGGFTNQYSNVTSPAAVANAGRGGDRYNNATNAVNGYGGGGGGSYTGASGSGGHGIVVVRYKIS